MLKRTIKYVDVNKQQKEEVFYFHLSKANVLRWEAGFFQGGGLKAHLEHVQETRDGDAILAFFEKLILDSYGIPNEDGGFDKSPELRSKFENSEAYSELLMELALDAEKGGEFFVGVMPADLEEQVAKAIKEAAAQEQELAPEKEAFADAMKYRDRTAQPPPGPRPAVHTESRKEPLEGALQPPAPLSDVTYLSESDIREMDAVELQNGLKTGRYKLAP